MILVIDNYDSFTWNLVDILRRLGDEVRVVFNDGMPAQQLPMKAAAGLLISPGPGRPKDSGISAEALQAWDEQKPFLGVCLGHQLLGEHFGMELLKGPAPVHGKTSQVYHDGKGIFDGMPNPFLAMRYHSLVLEPESLSDELEICAWTKDGSIMGLRHKHRPWHGLQFHPESILTEKGERLVENWMRLCNDISKA